MDEQTKAELMQLEREELVEKALKLQDEIEQNKKKIAYNKELIARNDAIIAQLKAQRERLENIAFLQRGLEEFVGEQRRALYRRYGVASSLDT